MTKTELIKELATHHALTQKDVIRLLTDVYAKIADELEAGNEFLIPGVGKLKVVETAERKARNPKTGESISVPAGRKAKFVAAKELKERLNA